MARPEELKGYVAVDPKYATQHPEAVKSYTYPSGKTYYYRPSVSASESRSGRRAGRTSSEIYAETLSKIEAGELTFKAGEVGTTAQWRPEEAPKTSTYEKVRITPQMAAARAGEISRQNPSLSNEESLAAAMAEMAGYEKIPSGGGEEATEHARTLARAFIVSNAAYMEAIAAGKSKQEAERIGLEAVPQWYEAKQEEFEAGHIKLKDKDDKDVWIPIDAWDKWPEKYQSIARSENVDKAMDAVKLDNEKFEAELKENDPRGYEIYKGKGYDAYQEYFDATYVALPDGKYISKVDLEKQPKGTQQILTTTGFVGLEEIQKVTWLFKGKEISNDERQQIISDYETKRNALIEQGKMYSDDWFALGSHPQDMMTLSQKSAGRLGIDILSFVAPPAKALKPEYTAKDISGIEWGLAGVNVALIATAFAPGAILGSVAGKAIITGISTTGAGLVGYETAKNWSELTPVQRGIGIGATVLYGLPALSTVARGIRITAAKPIPTTKGDIVSWKGLSIAQHPVIGRSEGRWVLGTRNITLPEAKLILEGYKPEMMLETKVFVNTKALKASGWSQVQVDYLTDTLKSRNLFAGKKSPFLSKEALIEPTARLDVDEIGVLMQQIARKGKQVKQVDLLYGSATIKAQVAPELRGWRAIHDWDISTTMSQSQTETFAKNILKELQKVGKGQYRISPKSPTLIEKKIGNTWEHIADIHSHEVVPGTVSPEIPKSKLDTTGEYSYGRMVAEPAITIKYPGYGKIDIMALSESGVRKADTILRVRQTPEGTAFRPPERGISQPGVPKDAADYYTILRTYEIGRMLPTGTAETWLKSWAKAMGYTPEQLAKVLPNIRKAMIEVASNTPSNLIGYRFTPAKSTTVASNATPTITIHVPSSLGASVSGSLAKQISTPISPYKLSQVSPPLLVSPTTAISQIIATDAPSISPSVRSKVSASIYKSISPLISKKAPPSSISKAVSKSLSPYVSKGIISPSISASISKSVSASPSLSPSLSPSPSPSPSLSPLLSPSPSPYPSPGPTPSPSPVPTPTPTPVPVPVPVPSPKPKPKPIPEISTAKEARRKSYEGAVAWQQGALKRKGKLVPVWKVWARPYEQKDLETFFENELPAGVKTVKGIESAYATVQQFRGKVAPRETQQADIGAFIATVHQPTPKPGGAGEIKFVRDIRGESDEALRKIALGTTARQLLKEIYPKKVKKKDADKMLKDKLSKMNTKQIANELRQASIDKARRKEVLKMLPDRERKQVEVMLSEPILYAPTRGMPKAEYLPAKLRRKKTKTKKVKSEPMLIGARL